METHRTIIERVALIILLGAALIESAVSRAQDRSVCTPFTVVSEDKLKNIKNGLSPDNAQWYREKMAKKYPRVCYVDPSSDPSIVLFITVTPDTYHGTQIVNQTSTQTVPVNGTITDENGNVSRIDGTEQATSTTSTAIPYSLEYGIVTLSIERKRSDGTFEILQTFQQKGLYNTLYGIPLGGRGHHPVHAVLEDAAKWVNDGGLSAERQGALQPMQPASRPITYGEQTLQARADAGEPKAEFALGLLYEFGDGMPQDYSLAATWYRKAAEQSLAPAEYQLGTLYEKGSGIQQDYAQAIALYLKAADQGDPSAQNNLGCLYYDGRGVPQDYAQALLWFSRAAEQGDADAETNLAVLYDKGRGVAQDEHQAAIWFRKGAEQSNTQAQFSLGVMYFNGQGVPKSYSDAYYWLDLDAARELDSSRRADAAKLRDESASHLTPNELSRAQERASQWFAGHNTRR